MAFTGVSLTKINDRAAESAQARSDFTYAQADLALHSPKIHPWTRSARLGLVCTDYFQIKVHVHWSLFISLWADLNYPFPKRQILHSSKLEESADDKLKLDENGRKFSKWVENTVGKGEIARFEQFLLFPQRFQRSRTADK